MNENLSGCFFWTQCRCTYMATVGVKGLIMRPQNHTWISWSILSRLLLAELFKRCVDWRVQVRRVTWPSVSIAPSILWNRLNRATTTAASGWYSWSGNGQTVYCCPTHRHIWSELAQWVPAPRTVELDVVTTPSSAPLKMADKMSQQLSAGRQVQTITYRVFGSEAKCEMA